MLRKFLICDGKHNQLYRTVSDRCVSSQKNSRTCLSLKVRQFYKFHFLLIHKRKTDGVTNLTGFLTIFGTRAIYIFC